MSGRVVAIGECMVEFAPQADGLYRLGFAGDTFNAAWYLRRLLPPAVAVDYLTALGDDAVSDRMAAFMAAAGVGTGHVARLTGGTPGLYVITLTEGERSFAYWRGQSAARRLAEDPARLDAALLGARAAVFSGITLAILPGQGRAALLAALTRARAAGTAVVFDPNLRPRLWPSAEAMRAAVAEAARVADVLLPSFDDEAAAFGDADPAATAARYAGLGVPLVVVKNGAGPILWRQGASQGEVAPRPVAEVVDTTAAGDSFNAGFLAARLGGATVPEAIARGAAVSARVIGARGALVPLDGP